MSGAGYEASGAASGAEIAAGRTDLPVRRRWTRWRVLLGLTFGYLIVLQALLAVILLDTAALPQLERKLGWTAAQQEFDDTYRRWSTALARSDSRARPGALLFLGDSIMRDLDTSSIARHTLNLAIPGETTARLLLRMEHYQSVRTARGVVLGVGVNDLGWRPIQDALTNYRRLLAKVPAETPVLMVTALPVDERIERMFKNPDIERLNEGLRAVCDQRPGCHLVDPAPRLIDNSGNLAATMHEGDGIHLSSIGHDAYWTVLNSAVLSAMPPARVTPPAE